MTLQNVDAERAVLGCILMDGELLQECRLVPKHFSHPVHRAIFQLMREMENSGDHVDVLTLTARLDQKTLQHMGGVSYFVEMAESVPHIDNFAYYEGLVRAAWKMAKASHIAGQMQERLSAERNERIIGEAISSLSELEESDAPLDGSIREHLIRLYEELQQDNGDLTGIDTGFPKLNAMTFGFQPGDLIILGGRPSMGKTAFMLQLALQAAGINAAVGLFSLEMKTIAIVRRFLACLASIDSGKIRNAKRRYTLNDWEQTAQTMSQLDALPLDVYDKAGITMPEIWAQTRRFTRKHPDKNILIIVDYLQLIGGESKNGDERFQEISNISRKLKQMARDLNVCVVAISQLSRKVESRHDKRPMLSDLRESGQLEQDADLVIFLYREKYYNKDTDLPDETEIIVAKQRNGPVGTIKMQFCEECGRFV